MTYDVRDDSNDDDNVDDVSDDSSHELMMPVNTIIMDLLLLSSTSTFTITATTSRRSIQHRLHELLQASECIIMLDGRPIARDGDGGLLETTQKRQRP